MLTGPFLLLAFQQAFRPRATVFTTLMLTTTRKMKWAHVDEEARHRHLACIYLPSRCSDTNILYIYILIADAAICLLILSGGDLVFARSLRT